ncbi:Coenzyme Q-binding protein coq10a, mitochondrial [Mortierella sp. GBA35]|nr:Coenzyme Q-binding protein coq10a, mitochondrial [Mortierella sp. GBA35]
MRNLIRTTAPCQRRVLHTCLCSSTKSPWSFTATTTTTTTSVASRRHFITLPKLPALPNLLKPLSSSRHYKDRRLLKYSQQEFYDVVANVDDYHKFLPWCTHSKMSAPLPFGSEGDRASRPKTRSGSIGSEKPSDLGTITGGGEVTIRHGELGIGFNSLQERYVSTVTCQEPWMVRAVSYDSKLFKELSTTWRFTPNIPKTTTLEATMDQEVQESQLLTRPAVEDPVEPLVSTLEEVLPSSSTSTSEPEISSTETMPPATTSAAEEEQPKHYFTAAAVFGEAALPRPRTARSASLSSAPSPPSPSPSTTSSTSIPSGAQQSAPTVESTLTPSAQPSPPTPRPSPPKHVILQRTASPSNLTTMKPSDYPSVWVDFEIEFEFASPVHASMSSLFFDQVSKEMLAAFVKRAEVLYGQR